MSNDCRRTVASKAEKYDHETLQIIDRFLRPDSNCIDIGCHSGKILRYLISHAPLGEHCAFEPLPEFHRKLVLEFGHCSRIYNIALSNSRGRSVFNYVESNAHYSGLRPRRYPGNSESIREIIVDTERLDGVLDREKKIDFIKADVEGAEYWVFQGGRRTISRHRPIIVFEFGLGGADYYGFTAEMMYGLLHGRCGLEISTMESLLKGGPQLSEAAFRLQFNRGLNYYFVAHPGGMV